MKALDDLAEALHLCAERRQVVLKLGVPLAEVSVLPRQIRRRARGGHGFSRGPSSEKALGRRRALTTQSADAAKSGDIIVSDRAASGGIDRFGGGTRPTALIHHMGIATRIASGSKTRSAGRRGVPLLRLTEPGASLPAGGGASEAQPGLEALTPIIVGLGSARSRSADPNHSRLASARRTRRPVEDYS